MNPTPTRHCHQCGTGYSLEGSPGRSETCERCRADLRICLNCAHYDRAAAHHCRERRSEPVLDKATANFCEWFDWARRIWTGPVENTREAAARARLRALFGEE